MSHVSLFELMLSVVIYLGFFASLVFIGFCIFIMIDPGTVRCKPWWWVYDVLTLLGGIGCMLVLARIIDFINELWWS